MKHLIIVLAACLSISAFAGEAKADAYQVRCSGAVGVLGSDAAATPTQDAIDFTSRAFDTAVQPTNSFTLYYKGRARATYSLDTINGGLLAQRMNYRPLNGLNVNSTTYAASANDLTKIVQKVNHSYDPQKIEEYVDINCLLLKVVPTPL